MEKKEFFKFEETKVPEVIDLTVEEEKKVEESPPN